MRDVEPTANAGDDVAAQAAEPTQAEIDDWAAREKARREAWLAGPTEEERRAYANSVKHRRLAETFDETQHRLDEGFRRGVHLGREGQLAAEGAMSLMYKWSRHTFRELVRAGREWEEETVMPNPRRRVSFDDDPD